MIVHAGLFNFRIFRWLATAPGHLAQYPVLRSHHYRSDPAQCDYSGCGNLRGGTGAGRAVVEPAQPDSAGGFRTGNCAQAGRLRAALFPLRLECVRLSDRRYFPGTGIRAPGDSAEPAYLAGAAAAVIGETASHAGGIPDAGVTRHRLDRSAVADDVLHLCGNGHRAVW